jgi:hypothetical protein
MNDAGVVESNQTKEQRAPAVKTMDKACKTDPTTQAQQ